jgi:hypothetical protein
VLLIFCILFGCWLRLLKTLFQFYFGALNQTVDVGGFYGFGVALIAVDIVVISVAVREALAA